MQSARQRITEERSGEFINELEGYMDRKDRRRQFFANKAHELYGNLCGVDWDKGTELPTERVMSPPSLEGKTPVIPCIEVDMKAINRIKQNRAERMLNMDQHLGQAIKKGHSDQVNGHLRTPSMVE
jgi:hypothetical protein